MADQIGISHFVTESYLLDFKGQVTLPMIGNYLLHAAANHADARGFGFHDMTKKNMAWVLSRMAVEMNRYPTVSEPVTLYTWIADAGKIFTSRCFQLTDQNENTLGYAHSVWAAIDMQTRKPLPLDANALAPYLVDKPCPIPPPNKLAPIDITAASAGSATVYTVKYSDLDVNGHLNSIKYIEHLLDTFELALFQQYTVKRFDITYFAEGLYGMELTLLREKLTDTLYRLEIKHDDKAICRAQITWN
jgi:acyl-ACP thioesterase